MMDEIPDERTKPFDRGKVGLALLEAIAKRRGYADHFDWHEKSAKEWGIVQTFKEELERDHGPLITSGVQHPGGGENLPPDYQLTTHTGERWAIEITELVNQKAVERTKRGQDVVALWPDDELIAKFRAIVSRKDKPKNVKGYDRYLLLVHVDESMLPAERLSAVLGAVTFETHLINEIYVLVSYDPSTQRYPMLKLPARKT
jgi:hypothetical protein